MLHQGNESFGPSKYTQLCESFLNGKLLSPLPKEAITRPSGVLIEDTRLNDLVTILLDGLNQSDGVTLNRNDILERANAIAVAINRAKNTNDPQVKRRAKLLKQRLVSRLGCTPDINWLVSFLNCRLDNIHDLTVGINKDSDLVLRNFDPSKPLDAFPSRYVLSRAKHTNSYVMIGCSLLTKEVPVKPLPHSLSTAIISKQTIDNRGNTTGMVIAIADFSRTCSSEFDPSKAAKAAKIATQLGIRYAASCQNISEFKSNHRLIFANLGNEIALRTGFDDNNPNKTANITIIRIFHYGNEYQVSAANFGDNSLYAWYPEYQNLQPLMPGSRATLDFFEFVIPEGVMLIPISNNIMSYISKIANTKFDGDPQNAIDVVAYLRDNALRIQQDEANTGPNNKVTGGDFVLCATELPRVELKPYYFDLRSTSLLPDYDEHAHSKSNIGYCSYDKRFHCGSAVAVGKSKSLEVFLQQGELQNYTKLSVEEKVKALTTLERSLASSNGLDKIMVATLDKDHLLLANTSDGRFFIVIYDQKRKIQTCVYKGKTDSLNNKLLDKESTNSVPDGPYTFSPVALPFSTLIPPNHSAYLIMLSPGFLESDFENKGIFQAELQKKFDILERDNLSAICEHTLASGLAQQALSFGASNVAVNMINLNPKKILEGAQVFGLMAGCSEKQIASIDCITALQNQVDILLKFMSNEEENLVADAGASHSSNAQAGTISVNTNLDGDSTTNQPM